MWFSISDQIKIRNISCKKEKKHKLGNETGKRKRNISWKKKKETLVSKRNRSLEDKGF